MYTKSLLIISTVLLSAFALAEDSMCSQNTITNALTYARLIEANEHDDVQSVITDISDLGYQPLTPQQYGKALQNYTIHAKGQATRNFLDLTVRELVSSKKLQFIYRTLKYVLNSDEMATPTHHIEYEGVFARAFINSEESQIVVAFRGSSIDLLDEVSHCLSSWKANAQQALGYESSTYYFASELVRLIKQTYPDYTISCTGISLGGGLAHYAAITNEVEGFCFNNPLLGQNYLQKIESTFPQYTDQTDEPKSPNIQHICVQDEILQTFMQLVSGKKLGHECSIPSYDSELSALDRHLTEHLVKHFEAAL